MIAHQKSEDRSQGAITTFCCMKRAADWGKSYPAHVNWIDERGKGPQKTLDLDERQIADINIICGAVRRSALQARVELVNHIDQLLTFGFSRLGSIE
jgi:hypothetical protein